MPGMYPPLIGFGSAGAIPGSRRAESGASTSVSAVPPVTGHPATVVSRPVSHSHTSRQQILLHPGLPAQQTEESHAQTGHHLSEPGKNGDKIEGSCTDIGEVGWSEYIRSWASF